MLFDLRGRGRRRTVRIVYSGLALLFFLGFVGFGVGSFGGGGVLELLGGKGSGGGGENYGAQVKAAKKVTVTQPNNPAAWSGLIHATLLQAGSGENYSNTQEAFTSKAQPLLTQVQEAWEHYLKLAAHHPDPELATEVMRIYTTGGGLTDPAEAVKTLKIEMKGRPANVTLYYDLAVLSYQAKDTREGDRAAAKAIALAPPADKKILEGRLAELKSGKSAASSGASAGGTTTSGGAGGPTTVTIPASKLGKGATKAQTVTIPSSALKSGANGQKSVTIPTSSLTKGPATSTSTVPTSTTTAPKK
jgi:hypothetical protein